MTTPHNPSPVVTPTMGEPPADAARTRRFKLRLSLPGKNIGGEWLCQMTGEAMAYQSYCGTHGTECVFTWYLHTDGKTYLNAHVKDHDDWWLSWESTANCLYLSSWMNAAAWKLEGGRLVRTSDGAVASLPIPQKWPLADAEFIMALPAGNPAALTVQEVDEPLGLAETAHGRARTHSA